LGLIGTILNGLYRVDALIGTGGFGVVYSATHAHLDQPRALKFLHVEGLKDKESALKRFIREAQVGVTLSHPGIVRVYEYQMWGATPYVVMELLRGQSLRERLDDEGPMRWPEALRLAIRISDALAAAHALQILHRDLTPGNVFLCEDGMTKVLDFGIALIATATRITRTGLVVGTPWYMAPEQGDPKSTLDRRVDVYSLGGIVYRAITGAKPFDEIADTYQLLAMLTRREQAFDAKKVPASVPASVVALIRKALSPDREGRFGSMIEFRQAAERCLGETRTLRASPTEPTLQASVTPEGNTQPTRDARPIPAPKAASGATEGRTMSVVSELAANEPATRRETPAARRARSKLRWVRLGVLVVTLGAATSFLLVHRAERKRERADVTPFTAEQEHAETFDASVGARAAVAPEPAGTAPPTPIATEPEPTLTQSSAPTARHTRKHDRDGVHARTAIAAPPVDEKRSPESTPTIETKPPPKRVPHPDAPANPFEER